MGTSNSIGVYKPGKPSIDLPPNIIRIGCTKVEKLYINQAALLEFKVEGVSKKDIGGSYKVKLLPSDSNILLFDSKKQTKYEFEVEKGWKFSVYVGGSKVVENARINVEVDGVKTLSFPISILQDKDVFSKEDVKRLKVSANSLGLTSTACINVADARISELLQDKNNFMNRNRQRMSHGEYTPRLKFLLSKGYVLGSIKEFRYNLNNGEIYRPKNLKESAKSYIENQIKNKIGYHVFYISMLNDVHVLTLLINNNNPCDTKFEVLDQGTKWQTNGEQSIVGIDDFFNNSTISLYDWYLKAHKTQGTDYTRIAKIKRL
ncbi:hypothetical protein ACM39_18615 [Chryseobacterium sp. FH2]|uniref:hypothetical protein n=1 Tax=Chryseobacterium sp. FH2 TaxID=1674291 RepID=UPI00065AF686|nr:hypothetical protein [Chryseobacterium sp. FH2]KMQ58369.1 hypothetical protein ACM39_18615 [Chryseobacterium sp. FH2]